jgi:hypothetical protein
LSGYFLFVEQSILSMLSGSPYVVWQLIQLQLWMLKLVTNGLNSR